jgi:hypothetical protein
VQEAFSREDLERVTKEATDFDSDDSYDPFGRFTMDQHYDLVEARASLRKWLYAHYGSDIWYLCAEEAHQRSFGTSIDECHKAHGLPEERPHIVHIDKWNVLEGFSRMDLARYANSPDTFEEFMVRNALKKAAAQILAKPDQTK